MRGDRFHTAHPLVVYGALALLVLVPLILLSVYAYRVAANSTTNLIRNNNLAAATVTRALVEREFEYRISILQGLASSTDFAGAVARRDEPAVRARLQALVTAYPRIVRAFVTDPEGLLWSDYPKAEESLGQNFSYRDWYAGLSRDWQPYVSRVYRRTARPQSLLVAVAVPVREPGGDEISGALVYQITLDGITGLLQNVELGEGGFVFLLDHVRTVAAHPGLDLQAREYDEYATVEVLHASDGAHEYVDPFSAERMLATAIPVRVAGQRWQVVAQQPREHAYRPLDILAAQISIAVVLLGLAAAGLVIWVARYHLQVRQLNAALAKENAERHRAEAALKSANETLEQRVEARTRELRDKDQQLLHAQKMEAVGRLAGGVAHDFNNLLTVITGYAEMIMESVAEPEPQHQSARQIHDAAQSAASLTRQLLAFSRRQMMQPEVLDLNAVVTRLDKMLERLIGEDIDLVIHLGKRLHPVKFDPGQIEQIIMNLVVNARDAMPDGGKLTIETANVDLDEDYVRDHTDAMPGSHAMIAISDTGIGMDSDTRAKIFEPFFTTKGPGQGTGLGLATVYGIVKQGGGNIWVYSEPGRGSTFKIYLPRTTDVAADLKTESPQLQSVHGSETILLVEDHQAVRELIERVLTMAGYNMFCAGNVAEAERLHDEHANDIHLLLTDIVLPDGGGPELAERLSARTPAMRIVFMSGYTDSAIVHHGAMPAGSAFIEKPIRPSVLLERMRGFLADVHGS